MTRFIVFTPLSTPGLHVWREGSNSDAYLHPVPDNTLPPGAFAFETQLGAGPQEHVLCQLFAWAGSGKSDWEKPEHIHRVPRLPDNTLPAVVWVFHGSERVLLADPFSRTEQTLRVHLITASKYINARLFAWNADGLSATEWDCQGHDESGPYFDIPLTGQAQSFFQFKFTRQIGDTWQPEPDFANRVWAAAADGAEIWTHSEARDVLRTQPVMRQLSVHFRQEIDPAHPPRMHVWQAGSDWVEDTVPEDEHTGWTTHRTLLYTGIPYRFQFWNPTIDQNAWEHPEALRELTIQDAEEWWTLEGDSQLFATQPQPNCPVEVTVGATAPSLAGSVPAGIRVWVNRARAPLAEDAGLKFTTYPDVTTSFAIIGAAEPFERHYLRASSTATLQATIVLGRAPVLAAAPPPNLFQDPPYLIRRPGAYADSGQLRFALHAPWCAQVDLEAEWMPAGARVPLQSTIDGAYWWIQIPVNTVTAGLAQSDYHGAWYRFILNGDDTQKVQDPAASWVEASAATSRSRLVRSDHYAWQSHDWQTPPWEYLRLYQVHPARFSNRGPGPSAFDHIRWELEDAGGYLGQLQITALQLMPVNEVGTTNSWGYDPAFFYAVENDYGGPEALKRLVDACHQRGIAVLLDVVFNHAGTTDNILWTTAQGDFFDGDTDWGAMINYDHPQVIHFFEQNLVYLLEEYKVDGFRFDFTRVIVHGHEWGEPHVRQTGSGGGWEFLHRLRAAVRAGNPGCVFIAEHLPNEWGVTNYGGPMDSQWDDDFHDRLKDAASGNPWVMPALADAMKLSQTQSDNWYKVTNYAESHDEVGNEDGRMANVAGFGRGLRMAKIAAAVVWLGRGMPMMFMGAEAGEYRQFQQGRNDVLDLAGYLSSDGNRRVRDWVNCLLALRGNANIQGPSPLGVTYAQDQQLAWVRGQGSECFVIVNFGGWTGWKSLAELNLPDHTYRELWNSTWPAFQVESEDEHTNGGRDARLGSGDWLQIPDFGVVVLERC